MARAGRLRPHVDEIGPLLLKPESLLRGNSYIAPQTVPRERIGGDVDDAHDVGAFAPRQALPTGYDKVCKG